MVSRRKDEAAARLSEAAFEAGRIEIDLHAEALQHVGGADASADRTIAMLGDRHAGRRGDHRGRGRDVEGADTVAAGARGIEHVAVVQVERPSAFAHRARTAGKFGGGLALHFERDQKTGHQCVRHDVIEDFANNAFGLRRVERSSPEGFRRKLRAG